MIQKLLHILISYYSIQPRVFPKFGCTISVSSQFSVFPYSTPTMVHMHMNVHITYTTQEELDGVRHNLRRDDITSLKRFWDAD